MTPNQYDDQERESFAQMARDAVAKERAVCQEKTVEQLLKQLRILVETACPVCRKREEKAMRRM